MKHLCRTTTIFLCLLLHLQVFGGEKPVLKFKASAIQIGAPVKVVLVYSHPKDQEILFPDTLYDFSPFEFLKKEIYPTQTSKNKSTDSVAYTLTTFDIAKQQGLSLPVYLFTGKDTSIIFSNTDTIQIKRLVQDTNPDLALKSNTQFQDLGQSFDYIFWLSTTLGIIFILGLAYIVLGKRVKRQIKLYFSKLAYDKFKNDFDRIISQLDSKKRTSDLDKLLGLWKKYLQNITNKPTTTFTSKEISEFINNPKLSIALNSIDRAIYGGEFADEVLKEVTILKIIAKEYYIKKQEEVKND